MCPPRLATLFDAGGRYAVPAAASPGMESSTKARGWESQPDAWIRRTMTEVMDMPMSTIKYTYTCHAHPDSVRWPGVHAGV